MFFPGPEISILLLNVRDPVTSIIFTAQVNDLEKKLREQMQQSESTSLALQQKVPSLVIIAFIIQCYPSMQYISEDKSPLHNRYFNIVLGERA